VIDLIAGLLLLRNPSAISVTHRDFMTTTRGGLLKQYFYFSMSLLIAAVVIYGFSHTVDHFLIHATPVRPWVLYLHGTVFSGWVVFFILQSTLIRTHNVRLHRTLGWFGVALGVLIPILGVSTAITMARFNTLNLHATDSGPFLAIQFNDMICFSVSFGLAIYWRRKPEFHRRLVLIASCVLTAAAFARFPFLPFVCSYVCVDSLILLGVVRDLIVTRRVHPVYRYALPALIVIQSTAMYLLLKAPPFWVKITGEILR
jgi:hypothetical protein